MKRIYLILTGISLILLSSCAQRAREAKGHQTVKIDTVVSADKQTFLQFPGKVKAAQDISLAFRVSGTISKIHVKTAPVYKRDNYWPNWTPPTIKYNWMLLKQNTSK